MMLQVLRKSDENPDAPPPPPPASWPNVRKGLMVRMRFWGMLYYDSNTETPKIVLTTFLGPYVTPTEATQATITRRPFYPKEP